jgi:hypothetical protein
MSTITIIDTDRASLWYHPESGIVHHEFRKYVCGANFRNVLNEGFEFVDKHGATKWLSDDRGNSALRPDDADWAMNDWAPRTASSGWKYWAIVLPESVIGKMNMQPYIQQEEALGVEVQIFTDPVLAMAWLESVE